MKSLNINFHHLYYFWVVAKEGGVTRAAERLGVAVQTISTQLSLLEQSLGKALLKLQGRRLVLTEAGHEALRYADQIFLLGEQMQEALAQDELGRTLRLTVGISDALPKIVCYNMLKCVLQPGRLAQKVRLICYEGKFENLLADLALHKLDVLLTDRAHQGNATLRVFSHLLAEYEMNMYSSPVSVEKYRRNFPASLQGAPMLLPSTNTALRTKLDLWFEEQNVKPEIVAEFEDSALLKAFGHGDLGMFPGPAIFIEDVKKQYGAEIVGAMHGVKEQCYALSAERKIQHPALELILREAANSFPQSSRTTS